ncbi:cation diffusion facilitator family transporter [Sulfurimonas aquatica]|uniref:Cation diffusion facilitator family transporter n=1 Tax=Sulfurimonas aquatica TaxID=2672570 RepID=A0A975GBW6_9BACT|nr:cation diffusion facilitator family transporter [Sulfurimonas aquatica]QSZ40644.1 cation diffusion facilitator family transporter [Sulfurimonas aquatica]
MSADHHHHDVSGKNLFITIILNVIITLAQVVGGVLSGSLALLSDALHNFSDVIALVVAYGANRLAAKPSDTDKTFGYKRAEILATLFNASVLIGIGIFLIFESFHKFYNPEVVDSIWVIALGILSIILNAISVLLVKDDAHENMNIRAAYLHLLTDVMTSVAVVVGGVLMYYYQLYWVDPIVSLIIATYLIWASVGLVKDSSAILMQFTPKDVDLEEILGLILQQEEINNAHHLHLWQLDEHRIHLEAHLDFNNNLSLEESQKIIDILEDRLSNSFGITHTTFQCEYNRCQTTEIIKQ